MARRGRGSSQTWRTFLRNHAAGIAAMDFLIVPTVGFRLLFILVILRHQRRRLISLSMTTNPTAEWIARQITDAFPWNDAPAHLIRDRDGSYGHAVTRRLAAMGIRDHPTAPRSAARWPACMAGRGNCAPSRTKKGGGERMETEGAAFLGDEPLGSPRLQQWRVQAWPGRVS
jgi:hypothetical protein